MKTLSSEVLPHAPSPLHRTCHVSVRLVAVMRACVHVQQYQLALHRLGPTTERHRCEMLLYINFLLFSVRFQTRQVCADRWRSQSVRCVAGGTSESCAKEAGQRRWRRSWSLCTTVGAVARGDDVDGLIDGVGSQPEVLRANLSVSISFLAWPRGLRGRDVAGRCVAQSRRQSRRMSRRGEMVKERKRPRGDGQR